MKIYIPIISVILISLVSCNEELETALAPEIFVREKTDTAFLNTVYVPGYVEVIDENGCTEIKPAGKINTSVAGAYYLDYDYTDAKGNRAATVTKTVHVVENRAAFLNGNYKAICTCTALPADIGGSSFNPTITTTNYTAAISTYTLNNHFQLIPLKIGFEYLTPLTSLIGNSITARFYHRNFVVGSGISSGTLSPLKNTFTLETTNYQITPAIKYNCRNVYAKVKDEAEYEKIKLTN